LAEVIADGAIQYGRSCGEESLADETEVRQIVLVQMREDELEDIEVEVVGRDHELRPGLSVVGDS